MNSKYIVLLLLLFFISSCSSPLTGDFGLYQTKENGKDYSFENQMISIDTVPVLVSQDFRRVEPVILPVRDPSAASNSAIRMVFTKEGTKKFAKASRENIGKPIILIYKDSILVAPIVTEEINQGRLDVTGDFTLEEITVIVNQMNSN